MTAKILDRLHTDHRRITKVLRAIEQLNTSLHEHRVGDDLDKLVCLLEYVADYPDQVHHPFEDEVFASLLQQELTQEERTQVDNNIDQHAQLKERTDALMNMLLVPASKQDVPKLREALAEFVALQREHIGFEESTVFPLAERTLNEDQWQALDESYVSGTDPLFDETEERFEAIFNYVVDEPYGEVAGRVHKPTSTEPAPEKNSAEVAAARTYASGVGLASEAFQKLGEIQQHHFMSLFSDYQESLRQLTTNPPPMVFADHLRRRTTHNYESTMEMLKVFNAEAERWRHLQSRTRPE